MRLFKKIVSKLKLFSVRFDKNDNIDKNMISAFKKISFLTIGIILLAITAFLMIIKLNINSISESNANDFFTSDYSEITAITEYIIQTPYEGIYISGTDYRYPKDGKYGTWFITNNDYTKLNEGRLEVTDNRIVEILDYLFIKRHYSNIRKTDDAIQFLCYTDANNSRGFAYSLNGDIPNIDYCTKLIPIQYDNWYYYERDYIEWKNNNSRQN